MQFISGVEGMDKALLKKLITVLKEHIETLDVEAEGMYLAMAYAMWGMVKNPDDKLLLIMKTFAEIDNAERRSRQEILHKLPESRHNGNSSGNNSQFR